MSRSISRPFGRAAAQPDTQPSAGASMPSVTDFVLRDTYGDTPHDIHPHAAAWASSQSNPMDQAPMRLPTGSSHNAPNRPRPATAEERAAYVRMRNAQMQQAQAQPQPQPPPQSQAPAAQPTTPPSDAPYSPPLATYAITAQSVDPSFRVPPTATYDAATMADPAPQTPANAPAPRAPSPSPSQQSVLDPGMAPPQPAPALGSPLQLSPPKRTSSLISAAPPASPSRRPAELEISYTSASGRSVTVRLFAP